MHLIIIVNLPVFCARERYSIISWETGSMKTTGSIQPQKNEETAARRIQEIAVWPVNAQTKGELGLILVREIQSYTMFDLQIIGGRLNSEIDKLPSPYRESIRPYFREQLFGKHHQLLAMHRTRAYARMSDPIRDPESFQKFCGMIPEGVFAWNDAGERNPVLSQSDEPPLLLPDGRIYHVRS